VNKDAGEKTMARAEEEISMVKKIRTGMIGTAHPHAPGKLSVLNTAPEFELVGVCEPDAARRAARTREKSFADVRWVSEEELLGDASVRAVVVEGQVRENVAAARRAIEAGKHVHLEKPGGTSLGEFKALLHAAQKRNLIVQMGYMFRYNPAFELLFRAAREGWLGDIFFIRGRIGTSLRAEARRGLGEYPGGMMFELGCHLLDGIITLMGAPVRVTPFLRADAGVPDGLADNALAVFEFPRAAAVIESAAMEVEPFPHRGLAAYGTKGTVIIEPLEPPALQLCLSAPTAGFQKGWQRVPIENRPRYVADFAELAACIRTGSPLSYSYDHDRVVQEALLRACGGIA
jgi:predicted dehydrogenase